MNALHSSHLRALIAAVTCGLVSAHAYASPLRVRATSLLATQAELTELQPHKTANSCTHSLEVWGTLRDELGVPIARAPVSVHLARPDGAPSVPLASPTTCGESARGSVVEISGSELRLWTDHAGVFCMQTCTQDGAVAVSARFAGGSYFEPAASELRVDQPRPAISMRFDPEPQVLRLDDDEVPIAVRVVGLSLAEWARAAVELADERGVSVGRLSLDEAGLASGTIHTDRLAQPGFGKLRATLVGPDLSAVQPTDCVVERRARVELFLLQATSRRFSDTIDLVIAARWRRGSVDGGVVELLQEGTLAAAGAAQQGLAHVTFIPALAAEETPHVLLRFHPNASFWEPGPARPLDLPTPRRSLWQAATLALVALALTAWWTRRWLLRHGLRRSPSTGARHPIPHAAPLRMVHEHEEAGTWTGRVVDAHDGNPLPDVRLAIVAPSFPVATARPAETPPEHAALPPTDSASELATAVSDRQGSFVLHLSSAPRGARLVLRGRWHVEADHPLPRSGEMVLALTSRRRALLERLVGWARQHLDPPLQRDPTPHEVAERWQAQGLGNFGARDDNGSPGDDGVVTWANALQSAAFGPQPVDRIAETAVEALEPQSPLRRRPLDKPQK